MKILKFLHSLILINHILSENRLLNDKKEKCGDSTEDFTISDSITKKEENIDNQNQEIKNENAIELKSKKEKKAFIYSDSFMNQPTFDNDASIKELSTIFDFKLDKKLLQCLEKNDFALYPKNRFIGKQQGNFLHFVHLVFSKKLPLFFSIDQILYPYIEITKELQRIVIEKGLYNILHQFLTNIIEYGKKEKYEQGILVYFSIALKFIDKNANVVLDDVCEKLIKKLLNFDAKDTNIIYNFTLLNNVRTFDKLNFIQNNPIFKGNEYIESISNCLRFFQNFHFVLEKELYSIYRIGNLIYKSGEDKTYREIKKFIKYFFNEEENIMNPLDIYLFINKNYKNDTTSNKALNNLYKLIKDKIIKKENLKFMSNFTFTYEKEEEEFYKEKNSYVTLFSSSLTIEEYVIYKLLNFEKLRLYPSFYEFVDIVHQGKYMSKVINARYAGKNISYTKKLYKFRDGIDCSETKNYIEDSLMQSIIEENDKWINSYENSFNYLLNIIGDNDNNKKIEKKEMKTFNTLIGVYTHFKKDILLFEQHTNITYCKNGQIIDVYFDPQTKFYKEIYKISIVFQNHLLELINVLNDKTIKIDLEQLIEKKMKRLFISYENILKGIELQQNKIYNEERIRIRDNMFYYDKRKNQYLGWYADLYKNLTEKMDFGLNIYGHNFFTAKPISKYDFKGAIIYIAMNYPEYGLISIDDKENKTKKLYIFSSYTGNEYPHGWVNNINYNGIKKLILSRQ